MKTDKDRPVSPKENHTKRHTADFVAPEAYHLKYPSEHGLDCVCPDTKSNQLSKCKVYVAVQRAPDQAQAAAANGRVLERMVEQEDTQPGYIQDFRKCCRVLLH